MRSVVELILCTAWIAGIVLAPGWMKLVALFPPYAFYLVVEKALQLAGIV